MKKTVKSISLILVLTLLLSACSLGISVFAASPKGDINVWVVAGQSNAVGCGDIDGNLEEKLEADPDVMSHFTDQRFTNGFDNVLIWNRDTAKEFVPVKIGQGKDDSCVGPEVGIASEVSKEGGMHAIIKISQGDTSLYANTYWKERDDGKTPMNYRYGTWTPPSYVAKYLTRGSGYTYDTYADKSDRYDADAVITEKNRFEGNKLIGNLYTAFISSVTAAVKNLRDQGYNPVLRGMYWMQGEADAAFDFAYGQTDTSAENSAAIAKDIYTKLLTCLIEDVRADFTDIFGYDCADMPFVIGKLARKPGTGTPRSLSGVTAAQEAVTNDESIGFCTLIVPSDYSGFAQLDGWHYDAPTQKWVGEQLVKMINSNIKTSYGTVPTDYSSAAEYPFVIFKNGKFVSAKAKWTEALDAGKLTGDGATILMRRNSETDGKYSNLSNVNGTLTIDLGGYTLSPGASLTYHSQQAIFAADAKASGTNSFVTTNIVVRNGTLLPTTNESNAYAAIINFHTWYDSENDKYGDGTKVFNFAFENVTFKATRENQALLASVYKTDSELTEKKATLNLTVKDCTIDANGKTGVTFINEVNSSNEVLCKINPVIIGGNIKANSESDVRLFKARADSAPSTLKLDREIGGKYTTLTLPSAAAAPTATYTSLKEGSLSWNTAGAVTSGTNKIYSLLASTLSAEREPRPEVLSKVTFGKNLSLELMIPSENVSGIKLNNAPVDIRSLDTKLIGGASHFVLSLSFPASEALSDISLTVTVNVSGTAVSHSYTLDIVEYSKAVITASDTSSSEKKLIREALSYIKASYSYFDKSSAAKLEKIDQLLGSSYNTSNTPLWSETAVKPAAGNGVRGASLILGDETAIRFYITETADKYLFKSDSRMLNTRAGSDSVGNYVDVLLTAAEMNDTITFTIEGTSYKGSYNLKAYYNYIKSLSKVDPKLVTLIERLAAYAESADLK